MTRKDYVKLAASLDWTRPVMGKASQYKPAEQRARMAAWKLAVTGIANTLHTDNGRFDRERFYRACGMPE